RVRADANAHATRENGKAQGEAYEQGVKALGEVYGAVQIARLLAEYQMKLVPDIAVGTNSGGLVDVLVARLLKGLGNHDVSAPLHVALGPTTPTTPKSNGASSTGLTTTPKS